MLRSDLASWILETIVRDTLALIEGRDPIMSTADAEKWYGRVSAW